MAADEKVERFVKQVLGCSCPDEVFQHIRRKQVHDEKGVFDRIDVGGRLLIYVVNIDPVQSAVALIDNAFHDGVTERNNGGYNRFRLVLVSTDADALRESLQASAEVSPLYDEKSHLHVIGVEEAQGVLAV